MTDFLFEPASPKQELMLKRASDTQIVVIGGAAGCVDKETEFLSQDGWKPLADYKHGDMVMQVDPVTKEGSLVEPLTYIKKPSTGFYELRTPRGINQMLSAEHKVLLYKNNGEHYIQSMTELLEAHNTSKLGINSHFHATYSYSGNSLGLSDDLLRFYTALKADGSLINENTGYWGVRLKKERKISRFNGLLKKLNITYKERYEESTGFSIYHFNLKHKACSKFFSDWMLCSREDAEIISDELKYWDGYLEPSGNRLSPITTVIKKDADAIQYFFNICGLKATVRSDGRKGQTYFTNGKEYIRKSDCYQISPTTQVKLSLQRKKGRKLVFNKVESGDFKYCFEVPSGFFVTRRGGDIVLTGNSGKSTILNHLPALVVDDPNSNCVLYRRTNPQLEGGLWPNGRDIYEDGVGNLGKPKVRDQKKEIIFPNKAKIKYQQAENTGKAKYDAQGQEVTLYGLDEATQFEWEFIEYLFSRLRSKSRHFSRIVMSCNPDADHHLRTIIDWYIGDDGFPIAERDGVIRYFKMESGEFVWGNSRREVGEKLGVPEEDWEGKILSFSFVSGTIYDNPIMMEINPSYLAFLEGLNEVDKAQLLYGNWDARPKGANYWEREWMNEILEKDVPKGITSCRAYDLATTERSQANKFPDPTACIHMAKDRNGYVYISGNYHQDFYDDYYEIYGQFCKRSGDRDRHIVYQAEVDGGDCTIILPVDPGSAGRTSYESMACNFAQAGFNVKADPTPTNKSKLTRFTPFATACENRLIYIVTDTFDKKTLEFIYKQLEAFDGERSSTHRKDEFPDVCATGYNYLMKAKVIRPYAMPDLSNCSTKLSSFRKQIR